MGGQVFDNSADQNEEIAAQVVWEEELENKYGHAPIGAGGGKIVGPGFAKQKQVMEQSNFYQNRKNRPAPKLIDRTKKRPQI